MLAVPLIKWIDSSACMLAYIVPVTYAGATFPQPFRQEKITLPGVTKMKNITLHTSVPNVEIQEEEEYYTDPNVEIELHRPT